MPLYKRKHFSLVEAQPELRPDELVYQIRFTKEIFKDYQEYLTRLNLYRQRVWTCKVSGKTNLTYEEALVSEKRANEKIQKFPKELMAPVLHMIQFSTLKLSDLVSTISSRLRKHLLVGAELNGRKEQSVHPCKILKVREKDVGDTEYEVGWLDMDKKVTSISILNAEDMIQKKLPFTRDVLKSFIRDSTSQNVPWVVHDELAKKHGIFTELPGELQGKFVFQNGCLKRIEQKRKDKEERSASILDAENGRTKKRKTERGDAQVLGKRKESKEEMKPKQEPIKYPMDDLLVQPGAEDPVFTVRPSPTRDFRVQMDCVADMLMVWDFCSSFSRLLHLWPFSLEDFENAICHRDSNPSLIVESHAAILNLLIKDEGKYYTLTQKKRRKRKITLVYWTEYLCDFLEMKDIRDLSNHLGIIKRGHYCLLDPNTKLCILREMISEALSTDAIVQLLDEYIEQRQALSAAKRNEAVEEAKKKRNEQQTLKSDSNMKELIDGSGSKSMEGHLRSSMDHVNGKQNGIVSKGKEFIVSNGYHASSCGYGKAKNKVAVKNLMNRLTDTGVTENGNEPSRMDGRTKTKRKNKDHKNPELSTKDLRDEKFDREMEKRFIRTSPLGKDRNYNRYWFFRRDGRIFVENSDFKQWGYYTSKEELDALLGSLNPKGERELALRKQLKKCYHKLCAALQKRSKDVAQRIALEEAALRRSSRVQSKPVNSQAKEFLRYINKWKEV